MNIDTEMAEVQKHRETNCDEIREKLREFQKVHHKNSNRLQSHLEYEISQCKNTLTNEALVREASDRELTAMMARQVQVLMQSSKCVNSTLGIDDDVDTRTYEVKK